MSAPTARRAPPDPYASFKNDRERLWALISRDVRLVLCMAVVAIGGWGLTPALMSFLVRLGKLT